jgi:hypothetical protein
MSRRDALIALGLALAIAAAVALSGPAGLAATGSGAKDRLTSSRYAYSAAVPEGWHRSRARLVPDLLMPREILSLGNFPMRVGGGGECGREPSASIRAMRPGDALVTIQEVSVTPGLRARLSKLFPPRPPDLGLASATGTAWRGTPATAGPIRYARILFGESGRAFEALAYVDGGSPSLRRQVEGILEGLRFGP